MALCDVILKTGTMTIINNNIYQQFTVSFAMASLLAVTSCDAEAKNTKTRLAKKAAVVATAAVAAKGLNLNTTHCTYASIPADKKWTWESADIKARLIPFEDEKYAVEVIASSCRAAVFADLAILSYQTLRKATVFASNQGGGMFTKICPSKYG